ncbi:MAG: hypothetical protein AAGG44_05645 [Planctomycetota bacterium]
MPSPNSAKLEELTLMLRQQYRALDKIVDGMGEDGALSVDVMGQHLKAIKQTESLLAPIRQEFIESGERLDQLAQEATEETIELVKGLMPKLAQLEKATAESAKRLFPKIQENVRAVQMQNAYQAGSR